MTLDRSAKWFEEFLSGKIITSTKIKDNRIKLFFSDGTIFSISSLGERDSLHGFLPSKIVAHTIDEEEKEYRWLSWNLQSSVTKAKILKCSECGDVVELGQVDHVCIRKGPEEYQSSNRTLRSGD